jgi:hypothetical protein
MALDAKIRGRWEGNQISVSRPVRNMTTQALHRDVFVSRIDNLLSHRVGRMFRPVMTILTKFYNGRLFQKEIRVRRMGGMTGIATSFLDWIVGQGPLNRFSLCCGILLLLLFGKLFLQSDGVYMTLSAHAFHIAHEKLFLR